ncbi:hypothetical protein [Catellatospora sp. NPDC049609]|uniref:HNH endonuclease n=1 Tax=Catellatospora sp. NPDC049609 TaxID=3155505 RepID=UPI00343FB573
MTWLKTSDTANDFDAVTAPLAWDPDPTWPTLDAATDMALMALLLRGLVDACAVRAARAGDYVVPVGTIAAQARTPHWRRLADLAERAGYWTRTEDGTAYELVRESEEFVHVRLKAEVEWEKVRKRDTGNKKLTAAVRHRDGDGCRHCGQIVDWNARTGTRAGTYDHRIPGQGAEGPDDLCVACNGCNAGRRDREPWNLLPVPRDPFYGDETVAFLTERGIIVNPSNPARTRTRRAAARTTGTTARPATPADTAPGDLAASQTTPSTATGRPAPADHAPRDPAAGGTPRPATPAVPGPRAPRPATPADTAPRSKTADQHAHRATGTAGSLPPDPGRVGSGTGRVGSGSPTPTPGDEPAQIQATPMPRHRSRGRRGRRGKSRE